MSAAISPENVAAVDPRACLRAVATGAVFAAGNRYRYELEGGTGSVTLRCGRDRGRTPVTPPWGHAGPVRTDSALLREAESCNVTS